MANLLAAPNWSNLRLVKELKRLAPDDTQNGYYSALDRVYGFVAPLLNTRPLGLEEFTDHDLAHSARVLERIGHVLPDDVRLNKAELYLLSLAALLHDAGLWTAKSEAHEIFGSADFRTYWRKLDNSQLETVDRLLADPAQRWIGIIGVQRLVAMYNRVFHADRLATVFLDEGSASGVVLRTLIGEEFIESLVAISVAHSWEKDRLQKDPLLREVRFGDELVCLRFLAVLLRLGDLLDLGHGRVSTLLWSYLAPMSTVSEAHWRKEMTLKVDYCDPHQIRISGLFDVSRDGAKAADSYRLACDWLKMLADETELAVSITNRLPDQFQSRVHLGGLQLDRDGVECKGMAWGANASFELSRQRVMQLLSNELYSNRTVFLRELIQNAVDATRAQMVRDRKSGLILAINAHDEEPWNWPSEITSDPRYDITVSESSTNEKGETYIIFSVSDQGIGMTPNDIKEYFLQVGKSYYTTDQFRREFSHTPISRFGIGFLSCLTVADHIEVITRHRTEPVGLKLDIQPPSDFFIITPDESASFGTTVTLRIKQTVVDELNHRYVTYGEHSLSDHEDHSLTTMLMGWGLFIEFAVITNDGRKHPKRPLDYLPEVPAFSETRCSVPVVVKTGTGREIAVGRVFYNVMGDNRLPYFHSVTPNTQVLTTIRGIGISCDPGVAAREQVQVILDFRKIPPDAFTAGRTIRWNNDFPRFVGDKVSEKLRSRTNEMLKERSSELEVIWSLFRDRTSPRRTHADLLPLRLNSQDVRWMSFEKIERLFDRFLIVPFHIAWKGPWTLDIPCVGIPNQQVASLKFDSRTSQTPIWGCSLINVESLCTAYLWPQSADTGDLSLFKHRATYTHDGLRSWHDSAVNKTLMNSAPIYRQLLNDVDLPDYDQEKDPWRYMGVQEYAHDNDGSITAESVATVLDSLDIVRFDDGIHLLLDGIDYWE